MRREVRDFHRALLDINSLLELCRRTPFEDKQPAPPMVLDIADRITFFALQEMLVHEIMPWTIGDQKMVQDLQIQVNEFMFAGCKIRWRRP